MNEDYYLALKVKGDSDYLGEFDVWRGLVFDKKMNNYGTCQFEIPADDDKLEILSALRRYELYVYRHDTIVWAGELAHRNGRLQANSPNYVTLTAYSFFETLYHRYTGASRVFNGVDAGTIAWTLIDEAQSETNGDYEITQGTIETTVNRDRKYYNDNLAEKIIQLTNVIDGFDFEITDDKVFNVFEHKGADLSASNVFEWGTNIKTVQITEDFTKPCNRAIILGEGFEDTQLRVERNDTTAQSTHKIREQVETAQNVSETQTMNDKGDEMLQRLKQPVLTIDLSQQQTTVPTFGALTLGDTVRVKIKEGVYDINNRFRIHGYTVQIGTNGEEDISYLVALQ